MLATLYYGNRLTLVIALILVAFHAVGLSSASLSVCEDGGVVAINDLLDQIRNAALGKDLPLRSLVIKDQIERVVLEGLRTFIIGTKILLESC